MGRSNAMRPFLLAAILSGIFLSGSAASQAADSSTTLQVSAASWGYAGQRKDVKSDVAKLCDGMPACKFMVNTTTLTDPAPGHDKGLIVQWQCGETTHRDQFPEDKYA